MVRFESLTLSHNNMIALKPVLLAWLEEAEAARRDPEGTNGLLPAGEKKREGSVINFLFLPIQNIFSFLEYQTLITR